MKGAAPDSHHVTTDMLPHKFLAATEYGKKERYYIEETQAFILTH